MLLGLNRPSYLNLTLGCLRAGVVVVPTDVHLATPTLIERVDDAHPAVVFAHEELTDLAVATGRRVEVVDEGWPSLSPGALGTWPVTRAMHYTSGTSGRSKGVYAGLLGEGGGHLLAEEERAIWDFRDNDVHLVCGPLYHSGPHRFALNTLLYGGRVVLMERFDADLALAAIAAERVTTSFMVPTHLARLLHHPTATATDLSSIRWIAHAGAPCPPAVKHRAIESFPPGAVHEFYGATEGQFTVITPDEWRERPGSVGRARAGRSLAILDSNGRTLGPGELGTVYTSAPPFARFEYWRDPARTAQAWRGDQFTVGDLGRLDDEGFLHLAGRRGDLIITGGVNVYPAEVERELLTHPAVSECAVFGIPDEEWGERVCAAVVSVSSVAVAADELQGWVRPRLTGAQTPKTIVIVDALPHTGSGKILRNALPGLLPHPPASAVRPPPN